MTEWIKWNGGDCPIPHVEMGKFEVRYRDGRTSFKAWKTNNVWKHIPEFRDEDIIAYRLIDEEQSDLDWLEGEVNKLHKEYSENIESFAYTIYPPYYRVLDLIKERREAKS